MKTKILSGFVVFSIILFSHFSYSQDYILPIEGDTIKCYITKVKRDSIKYTYWGSGDQILDSALLLSQVKRFDYYFYEDYRTIVEEKVDSSKVRVVISFGTGLSFRLGKLDPAIPKEAEQDYRNGFNFTGKAGILISDVLGLGVKYNQHSTKSTVLGLQSTVKIKYFGPYVQLQTKPINNIMAISGMLGIGKLSYQENIIESFGFTNNSLDYTGSTLGVNIGASYILFLSQNANFSLDLNIVSGKIDDGELIDNNGTVSTNLPEENASTFNFGVSFHLLL